MPQPDVAQLFEHGLALHQQGQLAQAKLVYQQVLARQPVHFDAQHLSGVIALQSSDAVHAAEAIGKAIEIDPNNAAAYSNRGIALHELQRFEEAVASYDRAIAIKPDYAEAHSNRGNSLKDLRRLEEAVASFDRAIAIKPDYAEAHSNRGLALHGLKRAEEAVASFDKALAIKPDYADAFYSRGNALYELKRAEEALANYDRAIAIKPDFAEALSNRGAALYELNRVEEAVASYDRAIAIRPAYAEAYSNRGIALKKLKRVEEAIASYEKAIAIRPGYAEAWSNLGSALCESRRMAEAIASYDRAIETRPDHAEALFNKSLALLLTGDLVRGWDLYEWRWKNEQAGNKNRTFSKPPWLGNEDIRGKTILLHAEQGLGDTIQFSRYARLVKALGARVVLEVPKALVGLLGGLEGVDELVEAGQSLPAVDCHCPLLSLPLAFKTDLTTIPSPKPYLAAPPRKLEAWAQRLGASGKPRVGVMWSGSTIHKNDHNRSLALQELLPHLPGHCEYVSLQKDVREMDRPFLEAGGIRHYGDELEDFADTAALCRLMDLVISVDSSVAHLAGAIGQRTWVLLPYAPDWRWLLDRDDSPWYESVKLYRQDKSMEWQPVLESMARDLPAS